MKLNTFGLIASLVCSGAALAGQVGAGPGGTGSLIVGNTVQSATGAESNSPLPGKVGKITLPQDQAASVAAYLQTQPGTVINGSLITAPAVFEDGTSGKIELNTATGSLTMSRI